MASCVHGLHFEVAGTDSQGSQTLFPTPGHFIHFKTLNLPTHCTLLNGGACGFMKVWHWHWQTKGLFIIKWSDLARKDITTAVVASEGGAAPDEASGLPAPRVQPELLPLPAWTLPIEGIAGLRGGPPVLDQVGTAVTGQLIRQWVFHDHLSCRAGPSRSHLHAGLTLGRVHMVLEAAALRLMAGHIVGKILTGTARSRGFLLEALSQWCPVVGIPVLATVTSRPSSVSVKVEKLAHLTRPLRELPVAPLVWRPPVPVVKALAILLLLAATPLRGHRVAGKHKPLSKVARPAGVRLEALALWCK